VEEVALVLPHAPVEVHVEVLEHAGHDCFLTFFYVGSGGFPVVFDWQVADEVVGVGRRGGFGLGYRGLVLLDPVSFEELSADDGPAAWNRVRSSSRQCSRLTFDGEDFVVFDGGLDDLPQAAESLRRDGALVLVLDAAVGALHHLRRAVRRGCVLGARRGARDQRGDHDGLVQLFRRFQHYLACLCGFDDMCHGSGLPGQPLPQVAQGFFSSNHRRSTSLSARPSRLLQRNRAE
jgi:hypothetical protein